MERIAALLLNEPLRRMDILNPFVLRSVEPQPGDFAGVRLTQVRRLGKRIVLGFEHELYVVVHLMIAGRLRWREASKKIGGKLPLASFHFSAGVLWLTEAGSTRRASIHLVRGQHELSQFNRGGLEISAVSTAEFLARLRQENHTLKRALTDPRLFSGIGNAYSDEILHRARLSPLTLTSRLSDADAATLHDACIAVLDGWTRRLRLEAASGFPEKVTAFRDGMAVHGRYGMPCPDCGAPVQRIRYADNETNYCARCQTGGKLLADRALSRLLKGDWPRSIDELD